MAVIMPKKRKIHRLTSELIPETNMTHESRYTLLKNKNVYFLYPGWTFLFFCRLLAENTLVYI